MSDLSRRGFIGAAAAITGAAAIGAAATPAHAEPADPPAKAPKGKKSKVYGDIRDVKHVVVVMQENRSFDHYFGSMKGVRGFGDRSTIQLPGGASVWQQPITPTGNAPTQYPWQLSAATTYNGATPPNPQLGGANYGGTSHGWDDQHGAWYGGLMNGWYYAKGGPTTLGYLNRSDLPFHYALADAYTIGDAYHCSVLSATGPNRTYHWSGSINADQKHGSYVAYSGGDELGRFLPWESYAETLQKAGVSWRVYQCDDDYGDNGVEYFKAFAELDPAQGGTPAPGNPLYDNGVANVATDTKTQTGNADDLAAAIRADVLGGTLPQVSWVVNNQYFSEHPVTAPSNGAYFLRAVLEALAADEDVFNSTAVIINYDENDGQFDHVPPPVPAPGEADEFVTGTLTSYGVAAPVPVGLGFRVPLIIVSPWTRGGWVTSETFDHTSVIQFLEQWTTAIGVPAICPNISSWRRRVCGDLTSAFDFSSPVYGLPQLPDTGALVPETRYNPLPSTNSMPTQEPGTKPARALPYQPNANLVGFSADGAHLALSNSGPHASKAAHFAIYNNRAAAPALAAYPAAFPGQVTVDPSRYAHQTVAATAPVGAVAGDTAYDVTVVGPNRFLRRFTGDVSGPGAQLSVITSYVGDTRPALAVALRNDGNRPVTFTVTTNAYGTGSRSYTVPPQGEATHTVEPLAKAGGWYDLTISADRDATWTQRLVGHLESGKASITG